MSTQPRYITRREGRTHYTQTSLKRHIPLAWHRQSFRLSQRTLLGASAEGGRTGTHGTELGITRLMDKLELLE